jgi:hypothetical protein
MALYGQEKASGFVIGWLKMSKDQSELRPVIRLVDLTLDQVVWRQYGTADTNAIYPVGLLRLVEFQFCL